MITITLLCFPVDWETNSIYESDAVSYTAQILLCNLTNSANQTGSESDRDRESDRLGLRRGKASFPALCPDMAYLTCFSWSHCSRTVHENMKGRTTHGWEQWASLDTQTHTHRNKNPCSTKAFAHLREWRPVDKVFVFVSAWRLWHSSAPFLVAFLPLLSTSPFYFPLFFSLFFLFLLETSDTPSIFILLPRPANAIWAKNRKETKGQKKWNYWFDVSVN